MKTIEFNDGELQALMQLLDIAVKSGGLQVAQAASILAGKIQSTIGPASLEDQEIERSEVAEPSNLVEVVDSSVE